MGLFEYLAANEDTGRVSRRKAIAIFQKRASDRFGAFIKGATSEVDHQARLEMIREDLERLAAEVGEEYGVSAERLADASHLKEYQFKKKEDSDDDDSADSEVTEDDDSKEASVREARRPKMCPYHREVLDISLGTGDPQAGFNSMSGQAFGDSHCRGGFEGTCNFKPEMVTQDYWDKKAEEADQRRKDREQQQAIDSVPSAPEFEPPQLVEDDTAWQGDATDTSIDTELESAPSAVAEAEPAMAMAASMRVARLVPNPLIHGGTLMPLGMIAQRKPGLAVDGQPYEQWQAQMEDQLRQGGMPQLDAVEVSHPNPDWENVASDILQVGHDGPLTQFLQARKQRRQQGGPPGAPPGGPGGPPQGPLASRRQAVGPPGEGYDDPHPPELGDYANNEAELQRGWADDANSTSERCPQCGEPSVHAGGYFNNKNEDHQDQNVIIGPGLCPVCGYDAKQGDVPEGKTAWHKGAPKSDYDKYFGGSAEKAYREMIEQYGKEKGEEIFYATVNKKKKHSAMGAKEYRLLADAIRTAPGSDKQALVDHFVNYLGNTNPAFDAERFSQAALGNGGRDTYNPEQSRNYPFTDPQLPGMNASQRQAEALKTIDVEEGPAASPKMDKRKWTPQNVRRIDTEMEGSPHPTVEQDIVSGPAYKGGADDGRHEQTEAVTEKQDVTKNTGPKPKKNNNGWSNSNGAKPVTRKTQE